MYMLLMYGFIYLLKAKLKKISVNRVLFVFTYCFFVGGRGGGGVVGEADCYYINAMLSFV